MRAGEAWWSVLFLVAEYNAADASHATSVGGFLATSELRRRIGSEGETNRGSSCLQDAPTRAKGEASASPAQYKQHVALSGIEVTISDLS